MKIHRILRAAALTAALPLAVSCPVSADEKYYIDSETGEIVYQDIESQQQNEPFVSGDYQYTLLAGKEETDPYKVCIEGYTGSEAELKIPAELEGYEVIMLGDYAMVKSDTLTKVTIPKTVTSMGTYTFAECPNLLTIEVEEGNPELESRDGVLYSDGGATLLRYPVAKHPEKMEIDSSVTKIGSSAFVCCKTLSSVTFPDTLTEIGISAFADCNRLLSVTIPESVTEITPFCFNNCTALQDVTLPDTVTSIGKGAFANTSVEQIKIPEACKLIDEQAFAETPMKEITVPKSVETIGYSALGWALDQNNELMPVHGFVIRGYAGSAAEEYVNDADNKHGFTFEELSDETSQTPESSASDESAAESSADESSAAEEKEKDNGIIRIIGLSICGLLLAVIAAVALISGKKEKQKKDKKTGKKENAGLTEEKEEHSDENRK